jgi:hypothetical protein
MIAGPSPALARAAAALAAVAANSLPADCGDQSGPSGSGASALEPFADFTR